VGAEKVYGNIREDLCVAEGAAIYAAYLDDPEIFGREVEITTRTCHALGIEVENGRFLEIIPANRKTPFERAQIFAPESQEQSEIKIEIFQGGARLVRDNTKIGTVDLPSEAVAAAKRGEDIRVVFNLDAEQMLTVKVRVGGFERNVVVRPT
jgi:molecular chaperone DnaK (HSP70)